MQPKISVIIPTFNRAHIVGETLESILNQTFGDWECLVVDDGSTDNTEEVLHSYQNRDCRIRFYKRPNNRLKGANACRNIGIENAKGEYLQFLDSDDLLGPDKFEMQLKELEKATEYSIATCKWGGVRMNKEKAKLYHGLPTYFSTKKPIQLIEVYGKRLTYFPPHVFLIPKNIISRTGKWDEELTINQDGEFFSRVILESSQILFCENTFVLYRAGAGGRTTSFQKNEKRRIDYMRSIEMISENILKRAGKNGHIYVKQTKAELFHKLKKENPKLIQQNKDFFSDKNSVPNYYFLRLISGLKRKASRRVEEIKFS